VIDACAARGYGGIVFWRREIGPRAVEIGNRVRAAGLQVAGLCRTPYLVGSEAPRGDDDLRASIDTAAALGAPVLTIVTGGTEPGTKGVIETQKRLAERVAAAAPLAAAAGVSLALEPLNPMFGGNRTCLFTVADALAVADAVAASNVGIAVDVYHVWWDRTLAKSLAAAKGRVLGYHLCDWLEKHRQRVMPRPPVPSVRDDGLTWAQTDPEASGRSPALPNFAPSFCPRPYPRGATALWQRLSGRPIQRRFDPGSLSASAWPRNARCAARPCRIGVAVMAKARAILELSKR